MNDEMIRTESGLLVPASAQAPERPQMPQMLLLDGIPVPMAVFPKRGESPELLPLKGWIFEVTGVNPWAIMLRLRAPTPKTAKRLGEPEVIEGDLHWRTHGK